MDRFIRGLGLSLVLCFATTWGGCSGAPESKPAPAPKAEPSGVSKTSPPVEAPRREIPRAGYVLECPAAMRADCEKAIDEATSGAWKTADIPARAGEYERLQFLAKNNMVLLVRMRLETGVFERWPGFGTDIDDSGGRSVVTRVPGGTVADRAGVRVGDVLVSLDGKAITDYMSFFYAERAARGSVKVVVSREGKAIELAPQFEEKPVSGGRLSENSAKMISVAFAVQKAGGKPPSLPGGVGLEFYQQGARLVAGSALTRDGTLVEAFESGAPDESATGVGAIRKAVAVICEKFPPFQQAEVASRASALVDAALVKARDHLGAKRYQLAVDRAGEAVFVAELAKDKALVDRASAVRDEVEDRQVEAAAAQVTDLLTTKKLAEAAGAVTQLVAVWKERHIQKFLPIVADLMGQTIQTALGLGQEGKIKEGRALLTNLVEKVPSANVDAFKDAQGKLNALAVDKAKELVESAGKLEHREYQQAQRLSRSALELDPENKDAPELLKALEKAQAVFAPKNVTKLRVDTEEGLRIEFGLLNRDEKLVACDGVVRVKVGLSTHGYVVQVLYQQDYDATLAGFKETTVLPLGFQVPRIAYDKIRNPMGRLQWGTRDFNRTLIEGKNAITVVIEFYPTGSKTPVTASKEVFP